ncbi:STY0301 family protein [Xanthomonas sacchari]|nr:STY0301 family protein [Xanthomonas sacchari]MDV0440711.1 hypothetical protein [Xanthomonas sacchari]
MEPGAGVRSDLIDESDSRSTDDRARPLHCAPQQARQPFASQLRTDPPARQPSLASQDPRVSSASFMEVFLFHADATPAVHRAAPQRRSTPDSAGGEADFLDQGYTGERPADAAQMEATSMSSSKQLAALLLCLFGWRSALAAPSVCPIRQNQPLRSIDAFDGEPQDLATLEPDVAKERDGHWALGYIYDEGRFVTMRCKYADKQTQDVKLANRVEQCSYSINARNVLRVTCK